MRSEFHQVVYCPGADGDRHGVSRPQAVCELLATSANAHYWDITGGPGSFFFVRTGWLVVTADTARQLSIADRIYELRTGRVSQRAREQQQLLAEREAVLQAEGQ